MTRIEISGAKEYGSTVYVFVPEPLAEAWARMPEVFATVRAMTPEEKWPKLNVKTVTQLDETYIYLPAHVEA